MPGNFERPTPRSTAQYETCSQAARLHNLIRRRLDHGAKDVLDRMHRNTNEQQPIPLQEALWGELSDTEHEIANDFFIKVGGHILDITSQAYDYVSQLRQLDRKPTLIPFKPTAFQQVKDYFPIHKPSEN